MSSQDYSRDPYGGSRRSSTTSDWATTTTKAAKDAMSSASSFAQESVEGVKEAASETAQTVKSEVKQLLDRQVKGGAEVLGTVARSANRAAEDLARDAPQVAGLVRSFAGRVDEYSDQLRTQSFDQLVKNASDFTRRQPALVFGLAALAGFFALRTLKSSRSIAAPSIQPNTDVYSGGRSDVYSGGRSDIYGR
jgi:ElaB/YqjD/DUF883 family membrane-anchored ribosome-binding protein